MSKNANPSPLSINQEASKTDKNGSPLVGLILDIIDRERSRYKVAQAIVKVIEQLKFDAKQDLTTLLDRVESEVIGENEKLDATKNYAKHYLEDGHNDLRLYQRQALQALRKELE